VWTTHGLHALRRAEGVPGRLIRAGVRGAVGATATTLCCSRAERDELAALVPPALHDRLAVVPNGVDAPARDPRRRAAARAELAADDPALRLTAPGGAEPAVALFLGQLEARKDPLTAVRAARDAAAAGAPLVLLVAGDGPLLDAVRAEGGPAVRALGFRDDPERLLAAADFFLLPSEREGISFAVLEAMAHGLAMVGADGPGNPEAVGDAGLVLPAGDVPAFAAALGDLAADAPRRDGLGAAARERVVAEFPVERLLDGVRAAYGAMPSRRRSARLSGSGVA
jgi:glycosyltransferase involved in cell wall biosynthesis